MCLPPYRKSTQKRQIMSTSAPFRSISGAKTAKAGTCRLRGIHRTSQMDWDSASQWGTLWCPHCRRWDSALAPGGLTFTFHPANRSVFECSLVPLPTIRNFQESCRSIPRALRKQVLLTLNLGSFPRTSGIPTTFSNRLRVGSILPKGKKGIKAYVKVYM